MPLLKYLDLSTLHVRAETLNPSAAKGFLVAEYDYGAIYNVPGEDLEEYLAEVPEDLAIVLRYAKAQGCNLVRLDCDADVIDDLPTYHWE